MKIERKENSGLIEFGSLKCGDVFEYIMDEDVYIKTIDVADRKDDDEYNCALLNSGRYGYFPSDYKVKHYPNAKLVLED